MPTVDERANTRKSEIDTLASQMVSEDGARMRKLSKKIAELADWDDTKKFCITGGAGSGKTHLGGELASCMGIPVFDFDEYIPGGYVRDHREYRSRLVRGMSNLWDDLPRSRAGWIIEHVEACNGDMLQAFRPNFCVLVDANATHLLRMAQIRGALAADRDDELRLRAKRALESCEYARMQFEKVPGPVVLKGKGWEVKKMG